MVRVDAHASYPEAYVSRLVAEARRTGAASVVVAMAAVGRGGFQSAAAAAQNSVLDVADAAHVGRASGWVEHGRHALFDLDHFFGAGGYDESFEANEDAEFDIRLNRRGGRVWRTSGAVRVTYHARATPRALFSQYLQHGQAGARTLLRHRLRPNLRQLLPAAVFPATVLALLGFVQPALAAPAAAWLAACLAGGLVVGLKAGRREAFGAGPAAALMHLAWSIGFWRQLLVGSEPAPSQPGLVAREGLNG